MRTSAWPSPESLFIAAVMGLITGIGDGHPQRWAFVAVFAFLGGAGLTLAQGLVFAGASRLGRMVRARLTRT